MNAFQMYCEEEYSHRHHEQVAIELGTYSPVRRPTDPLDVYLTAPPALAAEAHRLASALWEHDSRMRVRRSVGFSDDLLPLRRADVILALTHRGNLEGVMGTIGWALGAGKPVVLIHGRERPERIWRGAAHVTRIEARDPLTVVPAISGALDRAVGLPQA